MNEYIENNTSELYSIKIFAIKFDKVQKEKN